MNSYGKGSSCLQRRCSYDPTERKVARYRFTHSLYPHAIAERVPAGWRLRLHQRVGEWLEHTYGAQTTAIAGPLAWHFEEAGDYQRAIRYLVLTAKNAAGRCRLR